MTITLFFLYMEVEARFRLVKPDLVEMFLENKKEIKIQEKKYLWEYLITAYYSPLVSDWLNCSWDCRVTASWHRLQDNEAWRVVACPRSFEFGTQLYIEWHGNVWCRDRGGAIKGNRLDLWVWWHTKKQEALNWGKQKRKIYLIK